MRGYKYEGGFKTPLLLAKLNITNRLASREHPQYDGFTDCKVWSKPSWNANDRGRPKIRTSWYLMWQAHSHSVIDRMIGWFVGSLILSSLVSMMFATWQLGRNIPVLFAEGRYFFFNPKFMYTKVPPPPQSNSTCICPFIECTWTISIIGFKSTSTCFWIPSLSSSISNSIY